MGTGNPTDSMYIVVYSKIEHLEYHQAESRLKCCEGGHRSCGCDTLELIGERVYNGMPNNAIIYILT